MQPRSTDFQFKYNDFVLALFDLCDWQRLSLKQSCENLAEFQDKDLILMTEYAVNAVNDALNGLNEFPKSCGRSEV